MAATSSALVLIHRKTKQRYPLRGEDFVIGRSTGNLVFDHDPKLSGKHCLIRLTPQGFAIYDLKTRTGVFINGVQLPVGKACILKPGAEITIGDQQFMIGNESENRPQRESLNSHRRPAGVNWPFRIRPTLAIALASTTGILIVTGVTAFMVAPQNGIRTSSLPGATGATGSSSTSIAPLTSIDAEMREALSHMQHFGEMVRRHEFTEEQSLRYLREELVPRFSSVHTQLQAFRPAKPDAKRVDLQRRMAGAYLGQVTAMANYIQTKDVKYSVELGEYNRQMQVLNDQRNGM